MQKQQQNHIYIYIYIYLFLDETVCILNEKMIPDVTIMVPELEIEKTYQSNSNISMDKCGGTRNFQTLHPQTLQFLSCSKKLSGASPYVEFS
jgi:hypothetical protein